MDEVLTDELVDQLLAGANMTGEINGPDGLLKQLTRRFVERAMETELIDHLGYEPHQEPPGGTGNTRNGPTPKTLITDHGEVQINTPRDRDGSFEPQMVRKGAVAVRGVRREDHRALRARGEHPRDQPPSFKS